MTSPPTITAAGPGNNGTTSSVTYTNPTHAAGDVLYWVGETGSTAGVSSPPSGWAHIPNSPRAQGSNVTSLNVLRHVCTTSSEANPVIPGQANHQVGLVIGVNGADLVLGPEDTGGQGVASNLGTGLSVTGTSTTFDNTLDILFVGSAADDTIDQWGTFANASLTSRTKVVSFGTTDGNGGSVNVVTGIRAVAGASGTWSATQTTSTQWCGIMLAIVPIQGTPVSLTGTVADTAIAAPAGSVSTQTNVSLTGAVAAVALAALAGTVAVQQQVSLTGAVTGFNLAAPAGSVATGSSSPVSVTGAVAGLTLAAPAGSVATQRQVTLAGAVANVAFAAPAGTISTQRQVSLTGAVANVSLTAPAGTVATVQTVALTGATSSIVIAAPAGAVATGGAVVPYIELTAPPRTGTLTAPERDALVAPPVSRTLTAPEVAVSDTLDRITQKQTAVLTRSINCSNRLTTAYPGQTITYTSAVATASGGAVIDEVVGSGTTLVFRLAVGSVPVSTDIDVVFTPTLSNGDVDPMNLTVGVAAV